jgi:hypothetical protein
MANPVDAFMRGFAVVDQLETNRANRDFMKQQRSRMYELWEREDQEYEREQLNRVRQEYLVQFDYELGNLVNEIGNEALELDKQAEAIEAREDFKDNEELENQAKGIREKAWQLRNKWFTPNAFVDGEFRGVSLAIQEVVKRMQQRDPSFGEHLALALGKDPGAGELVDSKNPVANVFTVPAEASPNGQASLAFEVNRTDGKTGPMTQNRTDRDGDPVDFVPVDTQAMFKIFGPGFASNDLAAGRFLRSQWQGAEERGNPRAVQKEDASAPASTSTAPTDGGTKGERPPPPPGSEYASDDPNDRRLIDPTYQDRVRDHRRSKQGTEFDTSYFQPEFQPQPEPEELPPAATDRFGRRVPTAQEIYSDVGYDIDMNDIREGSRRLNENVDAAVQAGARGVGEAAKAGTEAVSGWYQRWNTAIDVLRRSAPGLKFDKDGSPLITGLVEGWTGEEKAAAVSKPVENAREAKESTQNSAGNYTANKVATDEGADAAIQSAPVPDSQQTAQSMAQSVTSGTTGGRRVRRPSIMNLVNASALAKAGYIDKASLQRYAQTGSWAEDAGYQLLSLGNGNFVRMHKGSGEMTFGSMGGAPGSQLASPKDWQQYLNLQQDRTAGIFGDNEAGQAIFLGNLDEVYRIYGVPMQTPQDLAVASNSGLTRGIQQGAAFIQNFDPDTAQNLFEGTGDFKFWTDPKLRFSPASIAIGTLAATEHGIVSQEQADEYLTQYAWHLGRAMEGASPAALLQNVRNLEDEVSFRVKEARKAGERADREAIRREVVKEFIAELGK